MFRSQVTNARKLVDGLVQRAKEDEKAAGTASKDGREKALAKSSSSFIGLRTLCIWA